MAFSCSHSVNYKHLPREKGRAFDVTLFKRFLSVFKWWNRKLTLKCKLKCYMKYMKGPLGVSPGKGNLGTTRGKEKILLTSVGTEPTTSGLDLSLLYRLSYEVGQRKSEMRKSSPTLSVRPRSSVGRVTVDLIRSRSPSLGACNFPYSCHGVFTDRSIFSLN